MCKEDLKQYCKPLYVVLACMLCLSFCLFCEITAHAEESMKEYHVRTEQTWLSGPNSYEVHDYNIYIPETSSLYGYYYESVGYYTFMIVDDTRGEGQTAYNTTGYITYTHNDGTQSTVEKEDVGIQNYPTNRAISLSRGNALFNFYIIKDLLVDTDIPIFASGEALAAYLESGDTSGQINKPDIDWTIPHDFSTDKYVYDIPVPELSNVTHEGFSLSNWNSEYFVDVIVESEFNGLEIKSDVNNLAVTKYYLEYDSDWLFDSHYYNFTLSDVAVSQENINIADSFGVDIMSDLISDFVDWSVAYPKLSSLPSYSFFRYSPGIEVEYKSYHLYDDTGVASDLSQLNKSGQACTVYYVRYYTKDMKCSQWVKYTVRPAYQIGTYEKNGILNVGSVDVDLDGNVSIDENYQGNIDSSGNVSYDVPVSNMNKIDLDNSMNDFWSILKSMYYGMDSFPGIVRELFGFLPSWVTTFMGLSIFAVILMRFLGR